MAITAIYARKSTESDDRQVLSIDSQVRELKEFAQRQGLKVEHVFTESKSAKKPGRLVFTEIMRLANKGKIDQIICWKLDRLARNPIDGGALIWALEEGKLTKILTPQQTYDNTGNSKFWMSLEFGMAKKYVDDLSDNVKRGLRAKLEQGWLPNTPPIGYLNDRNTRTIVPDPERFRLIRKMWRLMLTGNYSTKRVLEIATEKWGLRTRPIFGGGGPMARSATYTMFRRPFYYGAIKQNGVLYPGKHKPMVTKSEFDRVQRILDGRSAPRPKRHVFAYTSLIRCGECGGQITAEHKKQRHGHRYVYYHCTRRKGDKSCSQRVIEVKALESQMREFLESVTLPSGIGELAGWIMRETYGDKLEQERAQLEALQKRIEAIGGEMEELTTLCIRKMIPYDEYVSKRNKLEGERLDLSEAVQKNEGRGARASESTLQEFRFAENVVRRFDKGSLIQKRAMIQWIGSNLTLLNGNLQITPRKPLEIVQRSVGSQREWYRKFEPGDLGEWKQRMNRPSNEWNAMCGLIDDVRTWIMKNKN